MEKKLAPWRMLRPGTRVQSVCGYKIGAHGTVKERLDESGNGYAPYGVVLDEDPGNTTDFVRWEIRPLRTRSGRVQMVRAGK